MLKNHRGLAETTEPQSTTSLHVQINVTMLSLQQIIKVCQNFNKYQEAMDHSCQGVEEKIVVNNADPISKQWKGRVPINKETNKYPNVKQCRNEWIV